MRHMHLINEIIFGPRHGQNYDRRKEWHIRLSHMHVLEKKNELLVYLSLLNTDCL